MGITFDPAKKLPLYFRVGRDCSKTINFTNSSGVNYDISGLTFQLIVYDQAGGNVILTMSEGAQLSKPTNYQLTITLTDTFTSIRPNKYFYVLNRTDGNSLIKSWLNGPAYFHDGEFDGLSENTTSIVIDESGSPITITVSDTINQFIGFNRKTDDYTIALGDNFNVIEMNKATANTLTVPPNSSVAFPVGSQVNVIQYGAGQTTIAPGSGVTLRYSVGLKLIAQYDGATLTKVGINEWYVNGALEA